MIPQNQAALCNHLTLYMERTESLHFVNRLGVSSLSTLAKFVLDISAHEQVKVCQRGMQTTFLKSITLFYSNRPSAYPHYSLIPPKPNPTNGGIHYI